MRYICSERMENVWIITVALLIMPVFFVALIAMFYVAVQPKEPTAVPIDKTSACKKVLSYIDQWNEEFCVKAMCGKYMREGDIRPIEAYYKPECSKVTNGRVISAIYCLPYGLIYDCPPSYSCYFVTNYRPNEKLYIVDDSLIWQFDHIRENVWHVPIEAYMRCNYLTGTITYTMTLLHKNGSFHTGTATIYYPNRYPLNTMWPIETIPYMIWPNCDGVHMNYTHLKPSCASWYWRLK